MKSRLLGAVGVFCLFTYQPASADLLDGEIRFSSNPSFTLVGFTKQLPLNQNVLAKPPGAPPAVPAPQALFLLGGGLLGLVGLAMGLVGLAKRKKAWSKRTCDPIASLIREWANPGVYELARKSPVRGVRTMITRRSARIIIVDDHPVVRAGLRKLISDEPDFLVAGEAAGVQGGMRLLDSTEPDAAIIDIILPDGSGLDLVKSIHNRAPDIRILVVSMHDESMFAERAIRAGAMGYIDKTEAPDKVVKALRQLLKGKLYLSPAVTERLLPSVAGGNQPKSMDAPLSNLSNRELEVYELIGRGLSNGDMAEMLHLTFKMIETHRTNIKKKLNLQSGDELIRRAMQWSLERQ